MARSIGSVYVDVEANTRKFTRESQRAAQRAGTRAGNTWGERFAQGRDRKADWNQWGAKTVGTSRKYGGLSGSGFGDSFKKRLNIDGRHIFSDVLGSAGRFGAQTARFWSDAFRTGVGQVSEHLLGAASKAAAKAEFASWGTSLGKLWTRMFKANASAEAPRVDHDTLDAFLSGVAQGKAYKRGLESAAKMGVSLSDLAGLSPELARLRGYMMGKELGEGVQDGVKAKSRGARDGFSYGRAFTRFAKIAMPTNWLPKRMDSTVRAVILSLMAAGGPLVALLSQLSAGLVALASAVGVAAAGMALALLPALGALAGALGAVVIGFTALSDAKGELKAFADAVKNQFKEMQKAVATPLFAGLTGPVTDAMKAVTPLLVTMAEAANKVAKQFLEMFKGLDFGALGAAFGPLIEQIGTIGTQAFKGLTDLMIVAAPAAERLLGNIADLATSFADWMGNGDNQAKFQEFLTRALDLGSQLGDVFKPFGSALMDIMDVATQGPAQALLDVLAQLAEQFKAFTSSAEGQDALKSWFESIAVLVVALKPVFQGLGEAMKRMVTPAAEKALIGLGEALGALLPLVGTLFNSLAESGILDVFTGLIVKLAGILESSGILYAFDRLATAIGEALAAAAPVAIRLFEALTPLIVALATTLAELLPPLMDALLPLFEGLADTLVELAPMFSELIQAIVPLIKPLLVPLGEILKAVGANTGLLIPLVQSVMTSFKALAPVIFPLIGLLAQILTATSRGITLFGTIVGKILELVGGFAEWVTESDFFKGAMKAVGGAIETVSGFIETLVGWVQTAIDWLGRIKVPDVLGTITDTLSNIGGAIGNLWPFASGGVVLGPTRALIGEAGPEAVIPLTRPLSQVDPSVRAMAALLRGEAGYAGVQTKATSAGPVVNVYPTQSDPEAVAYSVANRLAVMAG